MVAKRQTARSQTVSSFLVGIISGFVSGVVSSAIVSIVTIRLSSVIECHHGLQKHIDFTYTKMLNTEDDSKIYDDLQQLCAFIVETRNQLERLGQVDAAIIACQPYDMYSHIKSQLESEEISPRGVINDILLFQKKTSRLPISYLPLFPFGERIKQILTIYCKF